MPHLDQGASLGGGAPGPVRPGDYSGPGGEEWRHARGGRSGEGRTVLSALVRIADSTFARERERPFAGTELAAHWRAFARTATTWREERTGPYGVAVVANMFAIAAWREPEDYADLLVLAERHGLHRLALVQHHLSTRIEGDRRLLLGSRFCHGLAPTHYGELPEDHRTTCARVGMRFMLAGAHEVEPGPDIETPEEFLRHFLEDGLPEWRAQIARYAEDPWSPYARRLNWQTMQPTLAAHAAEALPAGAVQIDLTAQQEHVFHAVISLHRDEGPFTDEQWQEVASKYMEAMGFIGAADQPGGRPDASWYAMNHGTSTEGNDHIHIVACLTRRDGSRVDVHNSGRRSQEVRRTVLEQLPFVTALHEPTRAENAATLRGFTAAEHNIARDRAARGEGPATPDRVLLQRIVRAAAAEASTEAGFINNVIKNPRMEIAAARWQPGTNKEVVTGYKIRVKDGNWFSASTLAPDLTLSKLRPNWSGETEESRAYARALWAEQAPGERRVVTPDAPAQLDQAAAQLATVNAALADLDPHDVGAWSHVEAATAGVTAVMSTAAPRGVDQDGRAVGFAVDAGRASDALTRQWLAADHVNVTGRAEVGGAPAGEEPKVPTGLSGMEVAARHVQLAVRATGTDQHAGWLAVLRQLSRTLDAIAGAKQARGELIAATTLQRDAIGAMARLEGWLADRVDQPGGAAAGEPAGGGPALSEAAQRAREASAHGHADRSASTSTGVPGVEAAPGSVGPARPGPVREPGRRPGSR